MDKKEFCWFRQKLQKTQKEMAQLLGISLKAVEACHDNGQWLEQRSLLGDPRL